MHTNQLKQLLPPFFLLPAFTVYFCKLLCLTELLNLEYSNISILGRDTGTKALVFSFVKVINT